eukprot:6185669-Pleurochrysis_carterae.AAC.1
MSATRANACRSLRRAMRAFAIRARAIQLRRAFSPEIGSRVARVADNAVLPARQRAGRSMLHRKVSLDHADQPYQMPSSTIKSSHF